MITRGTCDAGYSLALTVKMPGPNEASLARPGGFAAVVGVT